MNIEDKISELIDKYFTERTKNPMKDSDSKSIRKALESRIDEYFPKSLLNEILIRKGFLYSRMNNSECFFNISQKDIKTLIDSKIVLKYIDKKNNASFIQLVRINRFHSVSNYKYTFKHRIKINFKYIFIESHLTLRAIYNVLAKEVGISPYLMEEYIETLNDDIFPDIPEIFLKKLVKIFDIKKDECLTNFYSS